jgi:hypothetical protein
VSNFPQLYINTLFLSGGERGLSTEQPSLFIKLKQIMATASYFNQKGVS